MQSPSEPGAWGMTWESASWAKQRLGETLSETQSFFPPTSRASAPIWKCSALTLIQSSHLTGWNVGRKSSLQTQGSSSHPGRTVLERGERKCISSFLHLTNNKRNLIIRKHFWKQNLLLLGFQLFHTWWQYLRLTLSPAQVHSHSPDFDTQGGKRRPGRSKTEYMNTHINTDCEQPPLVSWTCRKLGLQKPCDHPPSREEENNLKTSKPTWESH